jgi:tetratricopeptide (TPR) repeat protein
VTCFRQVLSSLTDKRIGKNTRYGMEDAALTIKALVLSGLTIASLVGYCSPLLAQQNTPSHATILTEPPNQQAQRERRVALVIGNSRYTVVSPLRNPANDARDMTNALEELGFDRVISLVDGDLEEMLRALEEFQQELKRGGVGVFYYAGHGVQYEEKNYLIPVNANLEIESLLKTRTLPLDDVLSYMEAANNSLNIVILDACRHNPFRSFSRNTGMGLASVKAPTGVLVAYATAPGNTAGDGGEDNGIYTEALLKYIRTPGLPVESLFKIVRDEVRRATHNRQVPWETTSLVGDFTFNPTPETSTPGTTAPLRPSPTATASLEAQYAQIAALTFQQGQIALNAQSYSSAIESFDRALGINPHTAEVYLSRATAYLALNRYDNAIADYEKAQKLNPALSSRLANDLASAYQARGTLYSAQGDYNAALLDFDRAIELADNPALAYTGRGTVYYKQRNYDAALRDLDRAIELDPRAVEAYISRGDVYYRQHNYDTALADYNRAIQIDPQATNAYNGRGDVYSFQKEDYEAALRDYNRAIELAPEAPRGYVSRGSIYRYPQRNYAEALTEINRAIELDPNYAPAYRQRGLVYDNQKNYDAALREYHRAIELDPNHVPAYSNRGWVYFWQKNYDAALRDFNRAIELDPSYAPAYNGRGSIYYLQKDDSAALREYHRSIELDPYLWVGQRTRQRRSCHK